MTCPWSFVDQSTLPKKSMPTTKKPWDGVFFGSTCKQGKIVTVVIPLVCTPFLQRLLTWWTTWTTWAISKRFSHCLCVFLSLFLSTLACFPHLYMAFVFSMLDMWSMMIKILWVFVGSYNNWKFLHHFNCHRHHCWNSYHVPHPTSPIPWGDKKPISVAHWWHPYCHAHSSIHYHGHWFPSILPTCFSFYSFGLCYTITHLLLSFHQVDACIWTKASRPCLFQSWCCLNDHETL
jgi:hypothetical protein